MSDVDAYEADRRREHALLVGGQIAGMVMSLAVEDLEAAARSPGLLPDRRALVEAVLAFRRRVKEVAGA